MNKGEKFLEKEGIEDMVMTFNNQGESVLCSCLIDKALTEQLNIHNVIRPYKTYENVINGIRYWYFYDRSIKSWTVFEVDVVGNQVNGAEYFANKFSLLASYKLNFKNCV